MSEEVSQLIDELLEYFYEGQDELYPSCTVFNNGRFVSGIVSDELQALLIALREAQADEEIF
jgi:hypothetical protein